MRSSFIKNSLFLILLLGGCGKVPDSDKAKISAPIPLDQSVESALARDFFEEGGWPTARWWEMFEDPQLNQLVSLALEESPTLSKALARVQKVEQEAKKERSSLFPHLGADYEEQWDYFSKNGFVRSFYPTMPGVIVPPTVNQLDLTLNFEYEIDFFGRNQNLFKAALGAARAQRAEAMQATLILTTLVTQTYIELQTKLQQKLVLEERLRQRTQLLELTKSRAENGLDPMIPVLERDQSLLIVEQTIYILDKEIALDRHMLAMLVGLGPNANVAPMPMRAIYEKAIAIPKELSSDLLARRPDLTAQIWRVESAAKSIGAAQADFYPRVNLMAFAGLESLSFNQLLNIGSKQGGLTPAIHLPIFTGGKLTANLKEKVALFNEETYKYNELLLSAAREVADEVTQITTAHDTLKNQVKTLSSAREQLDLQVARYQNGLSNLLGVLDREENLFTQRYQLYSYQRDYLLSVLKMVKALGGGYHSQRSPALQGGT
jgi:NodT family efflux transporter outer membrane factor (OMF) lipoprotein